MINFKCPKCSSVPDFENPNQFDQALITCAECDAVYHIEGKNIDPKDRSYKQINTSPKGWRVERQPNRVVILLPSAIKKNKFALLFPLVFLGVLFFNTHDQFKYLDFGIAWLPFLVLLGVAVFMFLNAIRQQIIEVTPELWILRHSIPKFFGNRQEILLSDITQFFVRRIDRKVDNGTVASYTLCGILKNGAGEIQLLNNYPDPEPLYFLEQELEILLDIRDIAVEDEHDSRRSIKMNIGKAMSLFRAVRSANRKE